MARLLIVAALAWSGIAGCGGGRLAITDEARGSQQGPLPDAGWSQVPVSPARLLFDCPLVGAFAHQSLVVANPTQDPISIAAVTLGGDVNHAFRLDAPAMPFVLASSASRWIGVDYYPYRGAEQDHGVITVALLDGAVHGTAVVDGDGRLCALRTDTQAVDFGAVAVGATSEPTTVTISIASFEAPELLRSLTSLNPDFVVDSSQTRLSLQPGDSTSFTIRFRPSARGPIASRIDVLGRFSAPMAAVDVKGRGI